MTNLFLHPCFNDSSNTGPKDTYSNTTGATSLSQCKMCSAERTTGQTNASTTSTSCICLRSLYYQENKPISKCVDCPVGANCSATDGLLLSQVIPKPGYYLSTLQNDAATTTMHIDALPHFFLDCKKGYKTEELAKEICIGGERDQSKMCKQGYSGPLCVSNSRNDQ